MSAKHKRPFYVFAAVAAVCCLVLVTGVRGSKADDGRSPVIAGAQVTDPGHTLTPNPDGLDSSSSGSDSGSGAPVGPPPGWEGDFKITTPSLDEPFTGADGDDPEAGLIGLPPFDLPPPPAVYPDDVTVPATDDTDGKGRGERGGKKDKDKDKDKGKEEQEAEAEADAEPDPEEEVDPDVYGLPDGGEGDPGDGEPAEEPVDPEPTP